VLVPNIFIGKVGTAAALIDLHSPAVLLLLLLLPALRVPVHV
jgi:hypothetical protein